MRLSSGFSTGAARRRSSTRWRCGQSAHRSRRVGEVIRSTGDGTGSPARLPSKRVNDGLRRASMTAAPRAVLGSSVAAEVAARGEQGPQPVLLGGGRAPRAGAARRRRTPRARTQGTWLPCRSWAHHRVAVAGQVGAERRAPSGTGPARRCGGGRHGARTRSCRRAPARVARSWWCWRSTRSARSGELAAGAGPLVVGQQRVVADRGRERPLGQAEDHDQVEVEPDAHLDRPDEHAVAEPPDPAEVLLELELEGAVEHVERHRALDRVERAEAVKGLLDLLGRLALARRRPSARAGPRRRGARPSQRWAQAACSLHGRGRGRGGVRSSITSRTKPAEVARALAAVLAVAARAPTRADRRRARPRRRAPRSGSACCARRWSQSSRPATTAASRERRSQAVVGARRPSWRIGAEASHANTSCRRKPPAGSPRSSQQRAAGHPGGEGDDGGAVGGDAGRVELLVGEAGVGLGAGVEDRRCGRGGVPARTASTTARTAARTSSSPSDAVSTVVRSGSTAAPAAAGGSRRGRRRAGASDADAPRRRRRRRPCCPRSTVVGTWRPGRRAAGAVLRQPLGEVDDDGSERGGRAARRPSRWPPSRRSSSSDQCGLQPGPRGAVQAHDLGRPARWTPARASRAAGERSRSSR